MEISFTRIGLLMKKQFIENRKLYLFGTLAMMGIMAFAFIFRASFSSGIPQNDQGIFLGVGMVTFGCLFSLTLFSKLDSAKGKTELFMLPATIAQKMICAILFAAVIFPVVYITTIYPILRLVNYIDNNYMDHFNDAYTFNNMKILFLSVFYVMQALALLCSVFFRQYKIVKSVFLIFALFFGSIYIYTKIIDQFLFPSFKKEIKIEVRHFENSKLKSVEKQKINEFLTGRNASPFTEVRYISQKYELFLSVPSNQKNWFYILLYLSIPCMWFITWLRLRELEVN